MVSRIDVQPDLEQPHTYDIGGSEITVYPTAYHEYFVADSRRKPGQRWLVDLTNPAKGKCDCEAGRSGRVCGHVGAAILLAAERRLQPEEPAPAPRPKATPPPAARALPSIVYEPEPPKVTDPGASAIRAIVNNKREMDILRQRYPQANDAAWRWFLLQCEHRRLNPVTGQIHLTFRRQGRELQPVVLTGIDGYWLIAHRTGELTGSRAPEWCDSDERWHQVWSPDWGPPLAVRCSVERNGGRFEAVVHFEEVAAYQTDYDEAGNITGQRLNSVWARRMAGQLAKCGYAAALREAFPQELGGLYLDDEMQQAENWIEDEAPRRPGAVPAQDLPFLDEPSYPWREAYQAALGSSPFGERDVLEFLRANQRTVDARIDDFLNADPPTVPEALFRSIASWHDAGKPKERPRVAVAPAAQQNPPATPAAEPAAPAEDQPDLPWMEGPAQQEDQ